MDSYCPSPLSRIFFPHKKKKEEEEEEEEDNRKVVRS
jgi:hypothetical protein